MKCEHCGREIRDDLTFCSKCGHSFNKPSRKKGSVVPAIISAVSVAVIVGSALFVLLPKEEINRVHRKNRTENVKQEEIHEEPQQNEAQENEKIYTVVDEPNYAVLEIQKHNLHIEYPEHFIHENSDNDSTILSLKDPNEASMLEVMAFETGYKVPVSEVIDMLTSQIYDNEEMRLLDEAYDENVFMQKYRYKNSIIYSYGMSTENDICLFTFSYAEFEAHVYEEYFEHISENFYKLDDLTK